MSNKQLYTLIEPKQDLYYEATHIDPEKKMYLICIMYYSGDTEWVLEQGRSNVYEFLKSIIDMIDIYESFILVENVSLKDRKSVYAFMSYIEKIFNDGFRIDDHANLHEDGSDEETPDELYDIKQMSPKSPRGNFNIKTLLVDKDIETDDI